MNQSALKTFAQDARNKLRQLIGARLDYVLTADTADLRQQAAQVNELRAALKTEGRDPLIERVAYTWFNRLAALRFMDANGYHPFGARVITPATANETLPELLQQARSGALDPDLASTPVAHRSLTIGQLIIELLAGRIPVPHPEASIYRILLVAACNYYHDLMPFLFEKIGDATELLLPEDLLTEHSIVADFRENLTDEDCRNEEVLGWFYQYYISERKAEVDARNTTVPKEDIPAVTQLFTPHWIVRYLVENSLGRLWLLNRPNSRLREKMPYYIEGEPETDFLKITRPEEIHLLDDACGSGHMLTYAFDLLYAIYDEEGYDAPEIPGLILRHNLYGVDICDRAVALAAFALCMKARAKDNRFFRRVVQPHLISLQEIRFAEGELQAYFKALGHQPSTINPQLLQLLHQFEEAKNFGALIQPCLSEHEIQSVRNRLSTLNPQLSTSTSDLTVALTHAKALRVLEQAEYLSQRYHVVVANPPYLGARAFNDLLKVFTAEHFSDAKHDLYSCFIVRGMQTLLADGYAGLVTMETWMFLSSFEDLRHELLSKFAMRTLVHMPYEGRGRTSMGINFGTAAAIFRKSPLPQFKTQCSFVQHTDIDDNGVPFAFPVQNGRLCTKDLGRVEKIPGRPIAYWLSDAFLRIFDDAIVLKEIGDTRQGMATSDNGHFLRLWFEPSFNRIAFGCGSSRESRDRRAKWVPYNKGGDFRKWWGNQNYVVNWEDEGAELIEYAKSLYGSPTRTIKSISEYFKPSVSWSKVSSGSLAVRYFPPGFVFDVAGCSIFSNNEDNRRTVLAYLNTCLAKALLKFFSPSLNFEAGQIARLPILASKLQPSTQRLSELVETCIGAERQDWNNFETSWDFRDQPLLRPGLKGATLAASWRNWEAQSTAAIRRMQELETENNQLFITAYSLQDELKPDVSEEQITLARPDARKDMPAFLSYAVGCMFGRYSLDQPGLILADAGATSQDYLALIPHHSSFTPDQDGILPVLDGEWFQDDIVGRLREFLKVTYGENTLDENLAFIETSLGKLDAKTGKAKPTDLRTYFVRDFFKNHVSQERAYGYKKRPIYWMFSSPEGSFQALIYLHRYTRDTVNVLLNDYVREFIGKLEEKHRQLTAVNLNESARPGDRTKAVKELGKIDKMLKEIHAWERDVLLPLAQQRIELDLDDGVKVNYLKFKGAVVNIPGLDKGEEE